MQPCQNINCPKVNLEHIDFTQEQYLTRTISLNHPIPITQEEILIPDKETIHLIEKKVYINLFRKG